MYQLMSASAPNAQDEERVPNEDPAAVMDELERENCPMIYLSSKWLLSLSPEGQAFVLRKLRGFSYLQMDDGQGETMLLAKEGAMNEMQSMFRGD